MCSRPAKANRGAVVLAFATLAVFAVLTFLVCIANSPLTALDLASTSQARQVEQRRYSRHHRPEGHLSAGTEHKRQKGLQQNTASDKLADGKRRSDPKLNAWDQKKRKQGHHATEQEEQHCRGLTQAKCRADPLCFFRDKSSKEPSCKVCRHPPCRPPGATGGKSTTSLSGANVHHGALGEAQQLYPAKVGGYWSSGRPFLDETAMAGSDPLSAGIQLLLGSVNISALQKELIQQGPEMWDLEYQARENAFIDGRSGNVGYYKPGVRDQLLVFSDQKGTTAFQLPWADRYKPMLDPLLDDLLGPEQKGGIVRMQFAKMSGSATIKQHADLGGYATDGHRIHVPITLSSAVNFTSCPKPSVAHGSRKCVALQLEEGLAFELNNVIPHQVTHEGSNPRIHLVIDVMRDSASVERRTLHKGQRCMYTGTVPKMFVKC